MPEPALEPFALTPQTLARYVTALTELAEGDGPALLPHTGAAPELPAAPVLPADLGLVVATSGSTGHPKRAMLTRANLLASVEATHQVLGGPGQWLLTLPAQHIAGTQVILRSVIARRAPVLMNLTEGFTAAGFVDALAWMGPGRRYTSLVPAQLHRLLADPEATAALAELNGVLVGGAACSTSLRERAAAAGVSLHPTYGMSETAGGCVYAGTPLPGTRVHLDAGQRIGLSGPTVGCGYLDEPRRSSQAFDQDPLTGHWRFWTEDLGEWLGDRLEVHGRRDDVIITGGLKVAPRPVEEALVELAEVDQAVVLATPDPHWGQVVSAAIVPTGSASVAWSGLRERLRDRLPEHALPRRVLLVEHIPTRGPGKPDRVALAARAGWQNLR